MSRPAPACPARQEDIDCIEELGLGVMELLFGLGCWMIQTSPKGDSWIRWCLFGAGFLGLLIGIHRGITVAKKRLIPDVQGRSGDGSNGRPKFDNALWGPFAASQLVLLLQTPGSVPDEFSLSTAFLGLVATGFYAWEFAFSVPWKWLVTVILIAETMVVAVLPPAFLASLVHPSWTSKDFPPSLQGATPLVFALFGFTILISGGLSRWRSRRPIAPTPQEPE